MVVPLSANADEYVALWGRAGAAPWTFTSESGGPYGEEIWSTTAITPQNTGVNVHFDVPKGDGAWFVSAGGGPGSCSEDTGTAQAWVLTYKRKVGGQVTVAGSGIAAPNITVNANCSSGGTTTTNQNGYYDFLLDKGPCTIAPQLEPGDQSTPVQRVLDVTTDISDANFQVPCDAVPTSPAQGGSTAPRLADGLFDGPTCPVKLWVSPMENPVPSGLHFTRATGAAFYDPGQDSVPNGEPFSDKCGSGCEDVVVTVTKPDATKDDWQSYPGVSGVSVTATIGPVTPDNAEYPYPKAAGVFSAPGPQLCVVDPNDGQQDYSTCGGSVTATTDDHGKIYLTFWSPGVLNKAEFFLNATAHKCNPGTCTQVGDALKNNGAANLTVEPNVVFSRSGTLTAADADALMEWAYGKQITDDLSFLDYAPTLEYPALLQALKDRYSDYETLGAYNDLRIVAMLMARFGLKATGLFDQQLGDVIPHGSWITGDTFLPAMTSVAKDYGIWLHAVLPHDATYTVSPVKGKGIAQKMRLGIWELSYCNLDAPYICFDPRVGAQPGPYMVFVLYSAQTASALAANEASNKELQPGTAVPYMASDWMAAQFG